jgi:hypothetical protein
VHFDAAALSADESRLAEDLEVLRERRLRDRLFAEVEKGGAVPGTLLGDDADVDGDAHGIGKRMQDRFDRNIFDRGVK